MKDFFNIRRGFFLLSRLSPRQSKAREGLPEKAMENVNSAPLSRLPAWLELVFDIAWSGGL